MLNHPAAFQSLSQWAQENISCTNHHLWCCKVYTVLSAYSSFYCFFQCSGEFPDSFPRRDVGKLYDMYYIRLLNWSESPQQPISMHTLSHTVAVDQPWIVVCVHSYTFNGRNSLPSSWWPVRRSYWFRDWPQPWEYCSVCVCQSSGCWDPVSDNFRAEEAGEVAEKMLGHKLVTKQTGEQGRVCNKVMLRNVTGDFKLETLSTQLIACNVRVAYWFRSVPLIVQALSVLQNPLHM